MLVNQRIVLWMHLHTSYFNKSGIVTLCYVSILNQATLFQVMVQLVIGDSLVHVLFLYFLHCVFTNIHQIHNKSKSYIFSVYASCLHNENITP